MRRVVWSQAARDDYLAILRHIAAGDPLAAETIADAIARTGDALSEFATGHPGRIAGTYEKSVGQRLRYIIAYALSDDNRTVAILRVIHAARDWRADHWPD